MAPLKIKNDFILTDKITDLIKIYNYSPYAVVQYFQLNSWSTETRICEKTIYNYTESKVFNVLNVKDLPNKGIKYKENKLQSVFRVQHVQLGAFQIDQII